MWELFNGAKEELIESAMGDADADDADIGDEDDDLIEEEDEEIDDDEEEDDDSEEEEEEEDEDGSTTTTEVENRNFYEELFATVMLAKDPNDT